MSFKKASLVAMLATSMAAAPVMAQSAPAPAVESARGGAQMDDASALRGGFIIPLIAIIAIILGILAATHDDDDDLPHSP